MSPKYLCVIMASSELVVSSFDDPYLFKYDPLADLKKDIRLLQIIAVSGDHIECSLRHVSLQNEPEYLALSYCWGDPFQDKEIVINGKIFNVTANLFQALKAIHRYFDTAYWKYEDCCIWIDAICINQKDDQEKSSQVQQMDKVYQQAEEVLIWLGSEADGSAKVMAVLKWLEYSVLQRSFQYRGTLATSQFKAVRRYFKHSLLQLTKSLDRKYGIGIAELNALQDLWWKAEGDPAPKLPPVMKITTAFKKLFSQKCLFADDDPFWVEFIQLADRPWFSRVWTVQEVVMSKRATALCGDIWVVWGLLKACRRRLIDLNTPGICRACDLLELKSESVVRFMLRLELYDRSFKGKGSFADRLFFASSLRATDPRDLVYGLLGLVSDDVRSMITVDYSLKPSAVFAMAVKVACQDRDEIDTWFMMIQSFGRMHYTNLAQMEGLPSWCPDFSVKSQQLPLSIRGITRNRPELKISAVAREAWKFSYYLNFAEHSNIMLLSGVRLDVIKAAAKTAVDKGGPEQEDYIFTQRDEFLMWLRELAILFSLDEARVTGSSRTLRRFIDEESFGLTGNPHASVEEILMFSEQAEARDVSTETDTLIFQAGRRRIYNSLTRLPPANDGRYYFLTISGRFGIAPIAPQPGDQICFVPGAQFLNILSSNCRKHVAFAFVEGLMGDTPLERHDEWIQKLETFRLE